MKTAEDIFKEHEKRDGVHRYELISIDREELTKILTPFYQEITRLRSQVKTLKSKI